MHKTVISTLTATQLAKIFKQHSNFDLRSLLGGTDVLLDSMCKSFSDPSIFLDAIPSLKVAHKHRKIVTKCWNSLSHPKSLVFGVLIANKKVLSFLYPKHTKKLSVAAHDIALIFNFIYSSTSFKTVESWSPICLPHYSDSSFLHLYSCMISPDLFLVFLSEEKDSFFEMSDLKEKLWEVWPFLG